MEPEEANDFLSNHEKITVIERDLDPEDPQMGQAQFLITVETIEDEAEVQAEIEEQGLHYFKESSPNQFRHVAIPPQQE
jgi:hypothetical protein